ncbi:hypothetical protein [Kaistella montana]|uniref:Uncharacterized protein n=1 Tax=Kaistella montana TaxID=1849733 RepID=A0ABW5KBW2_9FLAO|nr:hypothetical protein [Kaistella montana]MCQ4035481.1 hypothetical protein [Kaistella montana]
MIKTTMTSIFALFVLLSAEQCDFSELFGSRDTEEDVSPSTQDNSTYTYKYKCPTGVENTIQIPSRLSAQCRANWEFYARTYGCNDADNFEKAESLKRQCP